MSAGFNAQASEAMASLSGFKGLENSASFMGRYKAPEYVVQGLLQAGMDYTLTANTGHAKTTVACLLAKCILTGEPFAGRRVKQGSVLFLAGENPDNVRVQWAAATNCKPGLIDHPNMHWHDGHFSLARASGQLLSQAANVPQLQLIIADTLQAFHGADDENDNSQMLAAARLFRRLAYELPTRPTVIVPAHPVKNATRDNLVPRGGSAQMNEFDGNLTLWKKDAIVEMSWQGKYRGAPFDPIKFELFQWSLLGRFDNFGQSITCAVARPMAPEREKQLREKEETSENRALAAIRDNPDITCVELGAKLDTSKSAAGRLIMKLREKKWLKQNGRGNALTPNGKAALGDD